MIAITSIVLLPIVALVEGYGHTEYTVRGSITSGNHIHSGDMDVCPRGEAVKGFKLKVEKDQGNGDDTALNAVRFYCTDDTRLQSLEGDWGKWGDKQYCRDGRAAIGVELRVEPDHDNDVTGANNIRLICSDGRRIEGENGRHWGDWYGETVCSRGYVCGLRTYVQSVRGKGDDMAMTGMGIMCC